MTHSGLVSRLRIACMLRRRAAEDAHEPSGGCHKSSPAMSMPFLKAQGHPVLRPQSDLVGGCEILLVPPLSAQQSKAVLRQVLPDVAGSAQRVEPAGADG